VDRNSGQLGYCGSDAAYNISSICIHRGEEPPISGPRGICNVFFSRCNLQCLFCQNYQISRRRGLIDQTAVTLAEVTDAIIAILDQGIESVGFVSPTHFTPHVKAIIGRLKRLGRQPVTVYNTNGYDKVEVLQSLEGMIDVYLPDFKYLDPSTARDYSDAPDYPDVIRKSILEMFRQKGSTVVLNQDGLAVTGMIIRHLVLPGHAEESIRILEWIASELSTSVRISLMSQYYPTICVAGHDVLGRKVKAGEYRRVVDAMEELGFCNGWIQQQESAGFYNPDFSMEHPFEP
jgi:putative pyruvate formate lyase activating enzyme